MLCWTKLNGSQLPKLSESVATQNDNMVLELAVSGGADFIVTGDQDLLVLDPFQGIRIVTPEAFLVAIRNPPRS